MTKTSLYQKYLVADQIEKHLEVVGCGSIYAMLNPNGVELAVMYDAQGNHLTREQREEKVVLFLAALPGAQLDRSVKSFETMPTLTVHGTAAHGITWSIDFGFGVCERVQVGTKKVEKYDPEALSAIPKIVVEEPVFEYRCPDPITQAGLVAA